MHFPFALSLSQQGRSRNLQNIASATVDSGVNRIIMSYTVKNCGDCGSGLLIYVTDWATAQDSAQALTAG
jgi:hypothetical protein